MIFQGEGGPNSNLVVEGPRGKYITHDNNRT